jgi:hypothetical protein
MVKIHVTWLSTERNNAASVIICHEIANKVVFWLPCKILNHRNCTIYQKAKNRQKMVQETSQSITI